MSKPVVHLIAAARPNFMKVAPLYHALHGEDWLDVRLVHTGQHYDANMSDAFFRDLRLPTPHLHLGVGSGSHARQTAGVMLAYEDACLQEPPAFTVVVGDVNSTMACTITAAKMNLRVAHLEAGLRSGDRSMPEEINRIVTDAIANVLWTPSEDADENLLREGVAGERIHRVGNIMIDSFEMMRPEIERKGLPAELGLADREYAVLTLHRPFNVDDPGTLAQIVRAVENLSERLPVVFPVHPRTRQKLEGSGLLARLDANPAVMLMDPLGYIDFMSLVLSCRLVITDSGGVQEETTYLGIPCLTLRPSTERPVTVTQGTNRLTDSNLLEQEVERVLEETPPQPAKIDLWDGKTALRVREHLKKLLVDRV